MSPAHSRLVTVIEADGRLRARIERWLASDPEFRCIGAFRDPETALASMVRAHPEIVLLNLEPPGRANAIECLWQIRANWPEIRVLAYPSVASAEVLLEALIAGADGLIDKPVHRADFLRQLREISSPNATPLSQARRALLDLARAWRPSPEDQPLTPREQAVLDLLKEGLPDKEIADRLKISRHTADGHLRGLFRKLHVHSRLEAVVQTTLVAR